MKTINREIKPKKLKDNFFKQDPPFNGKTIVSFSQYNLFNKCPLSWKIKYIDKIKLFQESIELVFGTAMHDTLEEYIHVYYEQTIKAADEMDIEDVFSKKMVDEYEKRYQKAGEHFSTEEEFYNYLADGINILRYFKKKKSLVLSKKNVQLINTEHNILIPALNDNPNVVMKLLLDVVLYNYKTKTLIIYDFKTSKKGWGDYKKKDKLSTDQLLLYKKYFSEKYNFPVDDIEITYVILKRKIYEQSEFVQRRIQMFEPANGKVSINKAMKRMEEFVSHGFLPNGKHNRDASYPAHAGPKNYNCTFCPFKDKPEHCNPKTRLRNNYLDI